MPRRALFLDRDGVINVDHGYVHRVDRFEFVPGIFDLVRFWTNDLQQPVVVATNQSGIGRGYFDERAYADLTDWMRERFAAERAPIARVYHCPYHPQHGVGEYRRDHPWRKPNPGMFLQAASDLDLDLAQSALVGDRMSDIAAAVAAGIGLRILLRSHAHDDGEDAACHAVDDLAQALALLRSRVTRGSQAGGER